MGLRAGGTGTAYTYVLWRHRGRREGPVPAEARGRGRVPLTGTTLARLGESSIALTFKILPVLFSLGTMGSIFLLDPSG